MIARRYEKDIQAGIVGVLRAHGILAFRMNSGAMRGSYKGRSWYVRFGFPGMADLLAFPASKVLWIECKRPGAKQSLDQERFQILVEREGHSYLLARAPEDVLSWFENYRKEK
mgnify:CR=1 FL=1